MIGSSIVSAARGRVAGYAHRLIGGPTPEPRSKHVWSIGIYSGNSPLALQADVAIPNPVLTRDHVTDLPASLVADPFLIRDGNDWHIFFEALDRRNGRGVIALATSGDLVRWTYRQVVLAE